MSAAIRDVRRGVEPDEIELVLEDGRVLLLQAYGLHLDEQLRTRGPRSPC